MQDGEFLKMECRLAVETDLSPLREMYRRLIENMNQNGIEIWDEVYPCDFFEEDIQRKRLYLLTKEDEILAAFALCESDDGENCIKWEKADAKAFYLNRFGVNSQNLRQGVGGLALGSATELARQKGADYLRLFAVDINEPAIRFYIKNGFSQAQGVYENNIDGDVLREYGFEIEL